MCFKVHKISNEHIFTIGGLVLWEFIRNADSRVLFSHPVNQPFSLGGSGTWYFQQTHQVILK